MKKTVLYLLGGVMLMFAASSCSSDEPTVGSTDPSTDINSGTSKITITANLPETVRSRSAADNSPANPLLQAGDMKNFYLGVWDMPMNGQTPQMLCDPIQLHGDELASLIENGKFVVNLEVPRSALMRIVCWTDNYDDQIFTILNEGDETGFLCGLHETVVSSYDKFAFAGSFGASGKTDRTIELTLRRPYAEVAVVSNQTETESFKTFWQDRLYTGLGFMEGPEETKTKYKLPIGYFNTNKRKEIIYQEQETTIEQRFAEADYPELIEGYKTLVMAKLLCVEGGLNSSGTTLEAPFKISFSREPNTVPLFTEVTSKIFDNLSFKANTRYIFVDNNENGDRWNGEFNLTLTIDSDFDSVNPSHQTDL